MLLVNIRHPFAFAGCVRIRGKTGQGHGWQGQRVSGKHLHERSVRSYEREDQEIHQFGSYVQDFAFYVAGCWDRSSCRGRHNPHQLFLRVDFASSGIPVKNSGGNVE